MKKLPITICLIAILLIAGCNSAGPDSNRVGRIRTWVASNESTTLRLGYLANPNIEVEYNELGVEAAWFECDGEPRTIGVYALRHLPGVVQIDNPLSGVEGWPDTFEGYPYFGAKIYRDLELETSGFEPFGGVRMPPFFFEVKAGTIEPTTFMFGFAYDF